MIISLCCVSKIKQTSHKVMWIQVYYPKKDKKAMTVKWLTRSLPLCFPHYYMKVTAGKMWRTALICNKKT